MTTQPQAGAPALPSAEFINQVFNEVPPPTAAPPPFGHTGLDLSTPRQAYLIASVRKGIQFDAIITEDEYDRVDPENLLKTPGFPRTCFVSGDGGCGCGREVFPADFGGVAEEWGKE